PCWQERAATSDCQGQGTCIAPVTMIQNAAASLVCTCLCGQLEQQVEDFNAPLRFSRQLRRRVLVLPLDANFEVAATQFSHGRLQHGDKVALPSSLGYQLLGMKLQPPWQFEIKRLAGRTTAAVAGDNDG